MPKRKTNLHPTMAGQRLNTGIQVRKRECQARQAKGRYIPIAWNLLSPNWKVIRKLTADIIRWCKILERGMRSRLEHAFRSKHRRSQVERWM